MSTFFELCVCDLSIPDIWLWSTTLNRDFCNAFRTLGLILIFPIGFYFSLFTVMPTYHNSFPVSIKLESETVKQLLTIIFPLPPTAFGVCYEGHQKLSKMSGWSPWLDKWGLFEFPMLSHWCRLKLLHRAYYTPQQLAVIPLCILLLLQLW